MGRQESPQLIERKTQVDTDAQETSRASIYCMTLYISFNRLKNNKIFNRISLVLADIR